MIMKVNGKIVRNAGAHPGLKQSIKKYVAVVEKTQQKNRMKNATSSKDH
jgi:hypothetical protein